MVAVIRSREYALAVQDIIETPEIRQMASDLLTGWIIGEVNPYSTEMTLACSRRYSEIRSETSPQARFIGTPVEAVRALILDTLERRTRLLQTLAVSPEAQADPELLEIVQEKIGLYTPLLETARNSD